MWLYMPAGYNSAGAPYPLLVMTDGDAYLSRLRIVATLDNLIEDGKIRPLVAVGVTSVDRNRDLNCSEAFGRFLAKELIPWVAARAHVSPRAAAVAVGGYSLGGRTAVCAVLRHLDRFGMALSQSGSFRRSGPAAGEQPEGMARYVAASDRRDVRFYLEVGTEEIGPLFGGDPSALTANRHLRDVLRAKGYEVTYLEHASGHEPVAWREMLHLGLEALVGR